MNMVICAAISLVDLCIVVVLVHIVLMLGCSRQVLLEMLKNETIRKNVKGFYLHL